MIGAMAPRCGFSCGCRRGCRRAVFWDVQREQYRWWQKCLVIHFSKSVCAAVAVPFPAGWEPAKTGRPKHPNEVSSPTTMKNTRTSLYNDPRARACLGR